MESALKEHQLRCYRRVYEGRKTVEVSGETVVPDTLPDIGVIGEITMHPLVRSKRAALGQAAMEGELEAAVSYLPEEEDGFCVLHLTLPWLGEFTGETLGETAAVMGGVQVRMMEARLLNPRKLLVKAQLDVEISAYEPGELNFWSEGEHDGAVQIRRETLSCGLIGTVCERSFAVTDTYPLSGSLQNGELLHSRVSFRVEEVKTIANKLIVKGNAFTDAVLADSRGETETVHFATAFSFIAETDCEQVTPEVLCQLFATGVYYEVSADGLNLEMEVHGVCQMAVYVPQTLNLVTDAYSNLFACEAKRTELEVLTDHRSGPRRETLTAALTGDEGLQTLELFTVSPLAVQKTGDGAQVPLQLSACVRTESGERAWLHQVIYWQLALEEGEWVNSLQILDAGGNLSGNAVSLRLTVEAELCRETWETCGAVSDIALDETRPTGRDRPSLTVLRTGGTLWDLAKDNGSSVELIRRLNSLDETEIGPDTLLLIPKQAKR